MKELVNVVNEITFTHMWQINNLDNEFDSIWNITKRAIPSSNLKAKSLNHFKKYNNVKDIKNKTWINIVYEIEGGHVSD